MEFPEEGIPLSLLFIVFTSGLALGVLMFYLYRRYSRRKLIRALYESHFPSESTNLYRRGSYFNSYGSIWSEDINRSQLKYSISNPIPWASPREDALTTLRPFPPLPDLDIVYRETDKSRAGCQSSKGPFEPNLPSTHEPSTGRHLRMAVRSSLHLAEVSPESIAVDHIVFNNEYRESTRFFAEKNLGSRHGKPKPDSKRETKPTNKNHITIFFDTNKTSKNSQPNESEETLLDKKPSNVSWNTSSVLDSKSSLSVNKPLLAEVFGDSGSFESINGRLGNHSRERSPKKKGKSKSKPNLSIKKLPLSKLTSSEDNSNPKLEKDDTEPRSVTFDDSSLGSSMLFGGKLKSTPSSATPSSKYILEKHFFSDEKTQEWNLPNFGKVRFTDHAPVAFRLIRRFFGYNIRDFDTALSSPFGSITSTEGKSNSIFFLTHNNAKFLFKTLRNSEPENLKSLLPDYLEHIRHNPNTLLPRYLGMYTFERLSSLPSKDVSSPAAHPRPHPMTHVFSPNLYKGKPVPTFPVPEQQILSSDEGFPTKMIVVVMANVFDTPLYIEERYDFKGSSVGRHTLPESAGNLPPTVKERCQDVSHLTLKDLDFQYRVSHGLSNRIHLGPTNKQELLSQLEIDLRLLKKFALMDYSILVGVSKSPRTPSFRVPNGTPTPSVRGSRSGSVVSHDFGNSPVSSPLTQASLIQPFHSASNFLTSLLPGTRSSMGKEMSPEEPHGHRKNMGSLNLASLDNDHPSLPVWQNGVRSVQLPSSEIYFIGIIDALQKYTIAKWIEKGIKGYNTRLLGPLNTGPNTPAPTPFAISSRINGSDSNLGNFQLGDRPQKTTMADDTRKCPLTSFVSHDIPSKASPSPIDRSTPYLNPHFEILSPSLKNPGEVTSTTPQLHKPPHPTPSSTPHLGTPLSGVSFLQQNEHSVEEPGRYAERLMEYMKSIIV